MKDETGKDKKIAWYDSEGEWHVTATGRAVEKTVEEAMQKWHNRVRPEPDTESE